MSVVTLRDMDEADLPAFYEWQQDPEATHMAAFRLRDADLDAYIERWRRNIADPATAQQSILSDGVLAGNIVCYPREGRREIGYWIDKAQWGKGIATAALRLFLEQIPERPLHATVAKDNIGSCRVIERAGFVAIGETSMFDETRGAQIDEVLYELR